MSLFKKISAADVHSEQAYFDALYASVHVNGTMICLGQLLQRAYHLFPNNTVLITQTARISYKELYARACMLARTLIARGIKPHDRILLFLEN